MDQDTPRCMHLGKHKKPCGEPAYCMVEWLNTGRIQELCRKHYAAAVWPLKLVSYINPKDAEAAARLPWARAKRAT